MSRAAIMVGTKVNNTKVSVLSQRSSSTQARARSIRTYDIGTCLPPRLGRCPWLGGAAVLATLATVGTPAAAQDTAFDGEFSVQRFNPAPGPRNLLTTRGARQDGEMTWSAGAMVNYAHRPFVVRSCISETDCDSPNAVEPDDVLVVENLVSADLMGSLTIIPSLQIGLRLPISWADGQGLTEEGEPDPDEISAVGLGDMELEGKFRFLGTPKSPFAAAGAVFVTVPFGSLTAESSYIGDRSVGAGARGIADLKLGNATIAANLVGMWRQPGRVGTTELGAELRYGVGAAYQFTPILAVLVDSFGSTAFSSKTGTNALEALLGARVTPGSLPVALTAGVGTGVIQGVGAPSVRALLGLVYLHEPHDEDGDGFLDERDGCPTLAEDFDDFEDGDGCPEPDNDGDEVLDAADRCPDVGEDPDRFQDDDGCPEPDNDGDGLLDDNDSCPNQAETKNDFEDEDGCPDEKDTDRDGIPDARDKCPEEPEDTDGFEDDDGCPEADNDGDGVPDSQDECGTEPETMNEFEDDDGCPDEAPKKYPWQR
ncbi:MAG: thrombospondin type 3 repeat-containing protein [Polyangiaceae bacterium]|nr:thrombospondin type 3 repeat-containing protein [Polyangiaceae bacterium]